MTADATCLETARLRLRRARPSDLDAIHAIMADAETMLYWSSPPHADRAQTAAWLDGMIAADPETGDEFVLEHDGAVIGKLGAWRLPEIGFFLARDHWHRGFAREALDAYIAHAARRGVACLTADVDPRNAACLRLLLGAGFHETGRATATYMVGGEVCDSVYLRRDLGVAPPAATA